MHLDNPFSDETRELFRDHYACYECFEVGVDALHHIMKRVSSSPFNAAVLHNFRCHIGRGDIHHEAVAKRYLAKTARLLNRQGYQLTPKDRDFMRRHAHLYEADTLRYWLGEIYGGENNHQGDAL